MNKQSDIIILGDWGTSVCRLYLCRFYQQQLTVLARTQGMGIKYISNPETRFFELCQPWIDQYGNIPVFLIGAVGSDIGWQPTDYVACPTDKTNLLAMSKKFAARGLDITILPGISCENRHHLPDIMRGEETQIFGFLSQLPDKANKRLICLPGTHTKWALCEEETITSFITSPVGELYEVLSLHSVLLGPAAEHSWCKSSFTNGLRIGMHQSSNLLHTLFATRACQVIEKRTNTEAAGYLSGLLIGSDVKAAVQDFDIYSHVVVIGSDHICSLYIEALEYIGISTEHFSSEDATLLGLQTLASANWADMASGVINGQS
ncbi:2-dehydro-3-deoxygalactonokinase [Paraglaciecola sp. 20A4]|uniref:2-dehydro-3-deoxygalactonokinase n=1 Tax=Paraglaciecola sp. 20A4 TaxID=2687288 RepID=UPI00140C723A|nr:2-dehydro-3-deoxygalactonokinase [Paraglaciecola sp. 20A4]